MSRFEEIENSCFDSVRSSEGPTVVVSPPALSFIHSPAAQSTASNSSRSGSSPARSARLISVRSPSNEGRISADRVSAKADDDKEDQTKPRTTIYKSRIEPTKTVSPHLRPDSNDKAVQVSMLVTPRDAHSSLS